MAEIADRICIYCGKPAKGVRDGEHIVQKAIGGKRTITETSGRLVCNPCNNGPLSVVDNELCGRSYLAHIASQEIDASLYQVWDVDHASGNQLVEARPIWIDGELQGMHYYPQLIFQPSGVTVIGDAEDMVRFGNEGFRSVLIRAVYNAFHRHTSGAKKKGLFFEQIDRMLIDRGFRYDPRVFARRSIAEIARNVDGQLFIVRYMSPADKREILRQLDALDPHRTLKRWTQKRGSRQPRMASTFDLGRTMRGLMKIGFNILAAYCEKTPVNRTTFSEVVRLILGETHPREGILKSNGFVHADKLSDLNAPDKGHGFRMTWFANQWHFYASFFGGRIAAAVSFPGPNVERWNTLDIVASLHSKEWQAKRYNLALPILYPIKHHVQWVSIQDIAPTVKLQDAHANLTIEMAPVKTAKARR